MPRLRMRLCSSSPRLSFRVHHASLSASITPLSLRPSRLSFRVHHASLSASILPLSHTSSLLQPLSLLHSFAMPTIGNLHISLSRRCAVPTSPTLRFAPLLPRCHARIPLVVSRPSSTTPSSSTLTVSGELETFPLGISDFKKIRQPGLAYFDRTKYIPELQTKATDVQLICRPRRFGKSLTVTMLRYFHGFQFRDQYDELFKVCGYGMFSGKICMHITYAKHRVSTSMKLSKMAKSSLGSTWSWNLTSPSPVLTKLPTLWSPLGEK